MADEGTTTGAPDAGGGDDAEAQGMLADAVNDDGGSQEDQGDDPQQQLPEWAQKKLTKANNEAKNLRGRIKELQPLADEAQKLRDSQKSELEKLTEQLQVAQAEGAAATAAQLRIDVALEKAPDGMPKDQIRKLSKRLTGSTREELEEDADELFADFAPPSEDENGSGSDRRPKESLGKVRLPNSDKIQLEDETDPRKLAAKFGRSPF